MTAGCGVLIDDEDGSSNDNFTVGVDVEVEEIEIFSEDVVKFKSEFSLQSFFVSSSTGFQRTLLSSKIEFFTQSQVSRLR